MQIPELMRCDRINMTLTRAGCARLFVSAQEKRPAEHEGRFACFTCAVGAANAGVNLPSTAEAVEAIHTTCPRCFRRSDRLIRSRLCISCYNRQREVEIGANRKGGVPLLTKVLRSRLLFVVDGAGAHTIETDWVASTAEAVVSMSRRALGPMSFGWASGAPRSPQLALATVAGPAVPRCPLSAARAGRPARPCSVQLTLDMAA